MSLGSFLRVKDPPKPIANARGNEFPLEALSEIPAWMRLASPQKEAASLSFPSRASRRECSPGLVAPIAQLGHWALSHHPVPCCSRTDVSESIRSIHPAYFANTESSHVEYFSSLLLILEEPNHVYLHCQAEIHKKRRKAPSCRHCIGPVSKKLLFFFFFQIQLSSTACL